MTWASTLTRQQRRRLQRLCADVDRLIETDRRFFERRPDRSYRIRRSFRAEIEVKAILSNAVDLLPADQIWFTIVKQFWPGVQLRGLFQADVCLKTDLIPEAGCRKLYEAAALANPMGRELDRTITAAFKEGGRQ